MKRGADEALGTEMARQRMEERLNATLERAGVSAVQAAETTLPRDTRGSLVPALTPSQHEGIASMPNGSQSTSLVNDEIIAASPRLAAHIRSAAKCVKVAEMASALLEGGRVTLRNSAAFYEVLAAGLSEPKRLRSREYRAAFRRLYGAAIARLELFPPNAQPMLKLWELRVLTQIDLFTADQHRFEARIRSVRTRLLQLPCLNISDEPPPKPGSNGRVHLPQETRALWAEAIFECIEAALMAQQAWAKAEANSLVKAAFDRRQNFSDAEQEMLQQWDKRRSKESIKQRA
mmetsp:Transcript_41970/g.98370  ORF Transcript_41970/g.98370 Transcript_41970/m.98370 type:complete len:290 (+) Transcript_41970:70-939(+)